MGRTNFAIVILDNSSYNLSPSSSSVATGFVGVWKWGWIRFLEMVPSIAKVLYH
jgi:hypothetical protein